MLLLMLFSPWNEVVGQGKDCYPCEFANLLSVEYTGDPTLKPLCNTYASWNVNMATKAGSDCPILVRLSIKFTTTESYQETLELLEQVMNGMVYTGTIPIESDLVSPVDYSRTITFEPVILSAIGGQTFQLPFAYRPKVIALYNLLNVEIKTEVVNGSGDPMKCIKTVNPGDLDFDKEPYIMVEGTKKLSDLIDSDIIHPLGVTGLALIPDENNNPATLICDVPLFDIGVSDGFLLMSAGASVKILPGNTLNLNGVYMHTCPNFPLAKGIEVESGGTLNVEKNSVLSDARFAVDVRPGATLSVQNTVFEDNYIGLNLDMSNATEGTGQINLTAFNGNTFTTSEFGVAPAYPGMPEQPGAEGFCGIYLKNYQHFNVVQKNTFRNLANGIVAENSILNIGNMEFEGIAPSGISEPYPFAGRAVSMVSRNNTHWGNLNAFYGSINISKAHTGVYAKGMAGTVTNCTMTDVHTGINWMRSQGRDISLTNNDIEAEKYGIRSFLNEPLHPNSTMESNEIEITGVGNLYNPVVGIKVNEGQFSSNLSSGWKLLNNTITMKNGGKGITYTNGTAGTVSGNTVSSNSNFNDYTGISISNGYFSQVEYNTINQVANDPSNLGNTQGILSASGQWNRFSCNCVDNTNVGMQFLDMADFTDRVRGNHMNNHSIGLQLGYENVTNVVIGKQNHRGNSWDLNALSGGNTGGINWNVFDVKGSEFIVDGIENASFLPSVEPSNGWFVPLTENTPSFSCENECKFPTNPPAFAGEDDTATDLDISILNDALTQDKEWGWKGRYRLYRKLLRHPDMAMNQGFSDFMTNYEHSSEGKLAVIAEAQKALYQLTPSQEQAIADYRNSLQAYNVQIFTLDNAQHNGDNLNIAQYEEISTQEEYTREQLDLLLKAIDTERTALANTLRLDNKAVETTLNSDANQKAVNDIMLTIIAGEELTSDMIHTLEAIALQCPTEGGDAVYEARSVVSHYTGAGYNDEQVCQAAGARESSLKKVSTNDLQLYPNPTTGLIRWSGYDGETLHVQIYNQLGQLVTERQSAANALWIGDMQEGLYQLRLLTSKRELVATQSVFVIH